MAYRVRVEPGELECSVGEDQTVLEAILESGKDWPFGCTHGMCGTCKARLVSGEVDQGEASPFALFDEEREEGLILLCCARPLTDLVITSPDD